MVRSWWEVSKPLGMRMRTMKYGSALPSPPCPPTTPAPSPWVYTPHQRKYVPIHSGGIEVKPSREKRRISSRPSQGFFSLLSRSTRCAFVSVTEFGIKNPPPAIRTGGGSISAEFKKFLGQQPPCASGHTHTTTSTELAASVGS